MQDLSQYISVFFQHNSGNVENRMKRASFICSLLTHTRTSSENS